MTISTSIAIRNYVFFFLIQMFIDIGDVMSIIIHRANH